jgi:hypothetical protein
MNAAIAGSIVVLVVVAGATVVVVSAAGVVVVVSAGAGGRAFTKTYVKPTMPATTRGRSHRPGFGSALLIGAKIVANRPNEACLRRFKRRE